jgi:aminopeptidase-like protein
MLSLSRVLPPGSPDWPYPAYHSDHDNPGILCPDSLEQSRDCVLAMIDAVETDCTPVNLFKGEIFCSRYGLHIDPYINPEGSRALFDIMDLVDGKRTMSEIAAASGVQLAAVKGVVHEMLRAGVIELAEDLSTPAGI